MLYVVVVIVGYGLVCLLVIVDVNVKVVLLVLNVFGIVLGAFRAVDIGKVLTCCVNVRDIEKEPILNTVQINTLRESIHRSNTINSGNSGSSSSKHSKNNFIKKTSTEKIAEFDRLKPQLDALSGKSLAVQIAQFRNERIDFANNTFDVSDSIYHIVGRCDGGLKIFNTSYDKIDIDDIHEVRDKEKSLSFVSGGEFYNFNKSKSVLMKRFFLPKEYKYVPVEILEDPLQLLSELLRKQTKELKKACLQKGVDYVVLPLYSTRGKVAHVQEKAGLNQWNASGRKRDENEVYIPIPAKIHKEYPDFFPTKDEPFELQLPHGESLSAKICQEGGKALMSNPNSALGEWILRKVLKKKPGELVTMEDLNRFGVDSVYIEKKHRKNDSGCEVFSISFTTSTYESYQNFFEED
jgi:hypothetical protein